MEQMMRTLACKIYEGQANPTVSYECPQGSRQKRVGMISKGTFFFRNFLGGKDGNPRGKQILERSLVYHRR
ncbi:hypothetical protein H5410_016137 [Solanum commersonii]|uniref:Uncharacterized protein n=1 Tax=Solanum commersonii TaxID=4109 RepID=A0A9J5ZVM7_SOLCO|nr:hypothetical protein H5410_016137 [Solanum commersonii]